MAETLDHVSLISFTEMMELFANLKCEKETMKSAVFCQREFSGFNFFWQKLTVTQSKGLENL